MKKIIIVLVLLAAGFAAFKLFGTSKPFTPALKYNSVLGSYYSPRNFPDSIIKLTKPEMDEYFNALNEFGGHVSIIQRWDDPSGIIRNYEKISDEARSRGFKTILHLDPLTEMTRKTAAPPSPLAKSFADQAVKSAYIQEVLDEAEKKPDVLGIGVEVNLLLHEKNRTEFENFVTLSKEAYKAIKEKYPNQTVTISFNWEIIQNDNQYAELQKFKDSLDVYSFTTYPTIFYKPWPLPSNYYSNIRRYLPTQRIGISELGFASAMTPYTVQNQADFYNRLPDLMKDVKPEFISQFYMFDQPVLPDLFKSMGVRGADGSAKQSWQAALNSYK